MAHDSETTPGPRGCLHALLWLAQALLAIAFGSAGLIKLFMPMPELVEMVGWAGALPPALVRFIGVAELLGAAGLVLPAAVRILPALTAVAAIGLSVIMSLAIVFHISRQEWTALPINVVFLALALFVVWGRLVKAPIPSRS